MIKIIVMKGDIALNNHKKFIILMVVLFNLILPLNIFAQEATTLEQGQATVRQAIKSGNKDFFTIVTPNNTTYYLVIDYDNNNKNVYFLKAVDEVDLIDLAGVNEIIYNQDTEEPPTEISSEEASEESSVNEAEEQIIELESGNKLDFFSIIAIIGLIALVGYIIYSKTKGKNKPETLDYNDDDFEEETEEPIEDLEGNKKETEVEEETNFIKNLGNKKDRTERSD